MERRVLALCTISCVLVVLLYFQFFLQYEHHMYSCSRGKPTPIFLNDSSFSSGKCVILWANASFSDPVQKDYYNAVSVFNSMRHFEG